MVAATPLGIDNASAAAVRIASADDRNSSEAPVPGASTRDVAATAFSV